MRQLAHWLNDMRWLKHREQKKTVIREMRALFILSTGRTGSKMLAELLNLSDRITAVHELKPRLFGLRKDVYDSGRFDDPAIVNEILSGERLKVYWKAAREGNVLVDSSPFLSFFAPALEVTFPHSRFLFMHRRPREFVRSGMRRGWYCDHPNDSVRLIPKPDSEEYEIWEAWTQFEKICWLWKEYNSVCLNLYDGLPDSRKLILPCADFWGEPIKSTEKIIQLLNLPMIPEEMVLNRMENPVNAQVTGAFPEREKWKESYHQQLKQIAGEIMERLGYI